MRTLHFLGLLLLSAFLFSCSTTSYSFDHDAETNLKDYKTFAWLSEYDNNNNKLKYQSLMGKRIKTTVESTLKEKGLAKVEFKKANFLINIQNKTERKAMIESSPRFYGGVRYRYYGAGFHDIDIEYYDEHTLFVDFIDPKKQQTVWRAVAKDYEATPEELQKTLKHILANFPEELKK